MKEFSWLLTKLRYRLAGRNKEVINQYFRKMGMKIGSCCSINSNIATTEPFLITLGENVTLAGNVSLVTHDNSISKMIPNTTDLFGRITIGNNCFIGSGSTLMYGVELADDITVAAGSVVTKSFMQSRIIIGGNPAQIIGTYDSFIEKNRKNAFNLYQIPSKKLKEEIEHSSKLVKRRINTK